MNLFRKIEAFSEEATKYMALLGRILYSSIFVAAAPSHFRPAAIAYAIHHGVPHAGIFVPLSGAIALFGGLCVLFGFKTKLGAWCLITFLVPVTILMHNFWAVNDPAAATLQQLMFMKNLSMLGGALMLAHFGGGPISIDGE